MAEVRAALETAIAAAGTTLIHVRTDQATTSPSTGACGRRWPPPSGPRSSVARVERREPPPRPARRPPPARRLTSKGIAKGDIVEVDRKGRRFHAVVTGIEQRESGRFELDLRPLDSRISYRRATVREVVTVYRRAR